VSSDKRPADDVLDLGARLGPVGDGGARRRPRVVAGLVAVLVASAATWLAFGRSADHGPSPAPLPSPVVAKPFLGAPPLCGEGGLAARFAAVLESGPCPTRPVPGRYLSLSSGFSLTRTYAFTLPAHWQVTGMDAMNGGSGPYGNGLVARSLTTGDAFAFTEAPIDESHEALDRTPSDWGPERLARWAASRPYLVASPVTEVAFAGVRAWQVDLSLRAGAKVLDRCLVVGRCAPVFEIWTALNGPHQAPIGVAPEGQSRALLFYPTVGNASNSSPLLVWVWGHYRTDDVTDPSSEVRRVVDSIVLDPSLG
jgi:hypothetical protein